MGRRRPCDRSSEICQGTLSESLSGFASKMKEDMNIDSVRA